jgi:hypothetical protein
VDVLGFVVVAVKSMVSWGPETGSAREGVGQIAAPQSRVETTARHDRETLHAARRVTPRGL